MVWESLNSLAGGIAQGLPTGMQLAKDYTALQQAREQARLQGEMSEVMRKGAEDGTIHRDPEKYFSAALPYAVQMGDMTTAAKLLESAQGARALRTRRSGLMAMQLAQNGGDPAAVAAAVNDVARLTNGGWTAAPGSDDANFLSLTTPGGGVQTLSREAASKVIGGYMMQELYGEKGATIQSEVAENEAQAASARADARYRGEATRWVGPQAQADIIQSGAAAEASRASAAASRTNSALALAADEREAAYQPEKVALTRAQTRAYERGDEAAVSGRIEDAVTDLDAFFEAQTTPDPLASAAGEEPSALAADPRLAGAAHTIATGLVNLEAAEGGTPSGTEAGRLATELAAKLRSGAANIVPVKGRDDIVAVYEPATGVTHALPADSVAKIQAYLGAGRKLPGSAPGGRGSAIEGQP